KGAVLERLGAIFVDGAGPMVTARAGDWRLYNNQICLTFASVEDDRTTGSFPIGGWRAASYRKDDRVPRALIDIALPGTSYDTLARFTQGTGINNDGALMKYDTAEPAKRGDEIGLRLEGSPFMNARLRLETVYWLAAGRNYVLIESRLLNLPSGQKPPIFCDD